MLGVALVVAVAWPETRIHVLTDKPLADWLVKRFGGAIFPHSITVYHYDHQSDGLVQVGLLVCNAAQGLRADMLRGSSG